MLYYCLLTLAHRCRWKWDENITIFIQENEFENICKMKVILSRPQYAKIKIPSPWKPTWNVVYHIQQHGHNDWATQWTRASVAIVLLWFCRNIPVSANMASEKTGLYFHITILNAFSWNKSIVHIISNFAGYFLLRVQLMINRIGSGTVLAPSR